MDAFREFREEDHPRAPQGSTGKYKGGEFVPAPQSGEGGRISQRNPTGVKSTEDPHTGNLKVEASSILSDPKLTASAAKAIRTYPGFADLQKMDDKKAAQTFVARVKDNILHLHDAYPEDLRNSAKQWYVGARRMVDEWTKEYNLPDTSVAGVIAALSPQKDWFENVAMAKQVIWIWTGHQDTPWDEKMQTEAERFLKPGDPNHAKMLEAVQGRTLAECKHPLEQALWIRAYSEAHTPRIVPVTTPEGTALGVRINKSVRKGEEGTADAKFAWQGFRNIAKALQCLQSGGDKTMISDLMGDKHKVRNFYNNIIAPDSKEGDVTIDTHAIAAGLFRPLSSKHTEVAHGLGSSPDKGEIGVASSSVTGVQGLYGLYAEAYRQAAAERKILPREMQSITWEAVRSLFAEMFKAQKKNTEAVDNVWREVDAGKLDPKAARAQIEKLANGYDKPDWAKTKGEH